MLRFSALSPCRIGRMHHSRLHYVGVALYMWVPLGTSAHVAGATDSKRWRFSEDLHSRCSPFTNPQGAQQKNLPTVSSPKLVYQFPLHASGPGICAPRFLYTICAGVWSCHTHLFMRTGDVYLQCTTSPSAVPLAHSHVPMVFFGSPVAVITST